MYIIFNLILYWYIRYKNYINITNPSTSFRFTTIKWWIMNIIVIHTVWVSMSIRVYSISVWVNEYQYRVCEWTYYTGVYEYVPWLIGYMNNNSYTIQNLNVNDWIINMNMKLDLEFKSYMNERANNWALVSTYSQYHIVSMSTRLRLYPSYTRYYKPIDENPNAFRYA